MWKFVVLFGLLLLGGAGGIAIVSTFEGNEVFTGYIAGFAAMLGIVIVLLMIIVAQLHNIESKRD